MKLAAVLVSVASAGCSAAAGNVVSSRHVRVHVALWVGGDDGLTQRLADAQRWLGSFEQPRAIAKWNVCRFHAAARSGWLK